MPKTKELNKVKKINHTLRNKIAKEHSKGYEAAINKIKSLTFIRKVKFLFS